MKVDIFCHVFPKKFYDRMLSVAGVGEHMQKRVRGIPSMIDLDVRFRMMDRFPDYVQVISLAAPPLEALGKPEQTADLARQAQAEPACPGGLRARGGRAQNTPGSRLREEYEV